MVEPLALFSELLHDHLRNGTRPDGTPGRPGKPWTNEEFAQAAGRSFDTVRKWLSGARRPKHTIEIEEGLFGLNRAYDFCRQQLRQAHNNTRTRSGAVPEYDLVDLFKGDNSVLEQPAYELWWRNRLCQALRERTGRPVTNLQVNLNPCSRGRIIKLWMECMDKEAVHDPSKNLPAGSHRAGQAV